MRKTIFSILALIAKNCPSYDIASANDWYLVLMLHTFLCTDKFILRFAINHFTVCSWEIKTIVAAKTTARKYSPRTL